MIHFFVYGSLKRGESNFANYCAGYRACEATTVRGRLFQYPLGYPMLVIPPEAILAPATADPLTDDRLQTEWAERPPPRTPLNEQFPAADDWHSIQGEIFSFDDPLTRVPDLDSLEGFQPLREGNLYERVLIYAENLRPIWVYIAPGGVLPEGSIRLGTSWPG